MSFANTTNNLGPSFLDWSCGLKKWWSARKHTSHFGRQPWWHGLWITAAMETDVPGDITAITVCSSVSHINTHTKSYLHYQCWPCSERPLKGHSVLLLLPVKCQQATPAPSDPSVPPNNKLQSRCWGALKHQTSSRQRWALLGQCSCFWTVIHHTMWEG